RSLHSFLHDALPISLAAVVAVAVLLGLFAAWRSASDLQEGLSASSRSYSGSGASYRLRSFLVVGEIATTLVILVGAGLLGRSFRSEEHTSELQSRGQ